MPGQRSAVVVTVAALVSAAHLGCSRGGDQARRASGAGPLQDPACVCAGEQVVDPTLLAFLSRSRAAHHAADIALTAGDRAAAIRALEGILVAPRPPGAPPEVAEVMADTHARLAELRSEAGDFDGAGREIEAGLKLAPRSSHYEGHLYEVAGVVEERRAKALDEKGERAAAEDARKRALALLERALSIQDQVISRALREAQEKPR